MWALALLLLFTVFQREEVSRVTPVWQILSLFATYLSTVFINSSLSSALLSLSSVLLSIV